MNLSLILAVIPQTLDRQLVNRRVSSSSTQISFWWNIYEVCLVCVLFPAVDMKWLLPISKTKSFLIWMQCNQYKIYNISMQIILKLTFLKNLKIIIKSCCRSHLGEWQSLTQVSRFPMGRVWTTDTTWGPQIKMIKSCIVSLCNNKSS